MSQNRLLKHLAGKTRPLVLGMVHLRPLPGSPLYNDSGISRIENIAVKEAETLAKAGLDGAVLENMWDVPYQREPDPVSTTAITRIAGAVKAAVPNEFLLGLQILAARNEEALAVAGAVGLDFIRAEGFVFGHLGDEGWMEACAPSLLRLRKNIGAQNVAILADIKKKHSAHAVTSDVSLGETAAAVEFFLGDGVIVTGSATGNAPKAEDVSEAKGASSLPVFLGSGVDAKNAASFAKCGADAFIVGSAFKRDGHWQNELDLTRIEVFMNVIKAL